MTLFRSLFRGPDDVYALRWQSNGSGRSGYAPACVNEWRPGLCEKPRISRAEYGLQAGSGYWDQRVGAKLLYRF